MEANAGGVLRIVVIDDDHAVNSGLCRLLQCAGFEVVGRAYDGNAGLALINSTSPDLAIVDVQMPGCNGFELASRIGKEVTSPPWLIAISGIYREPVRERIADAGFDAFLSKPAKWDDLEPILARFSAELSRSVA